MERLRFCLNDRWVELDDVSPTTTLLRYLRDNAHLTGTKEGCAEGDCGACTVAVLETIDGKAQYRAINSCLLLLPMIQGKRVYTVEALKDASGYHPVQHALADELGSQCGYCTPGVVMAMFETCYGEGFKEPWELDAALCGNLCRCTGYRPIREATAKVAGLRPVDRFARALHEAKPESMQLAYEATSQRFFTPATLGELWDVLDAHPNARFVNGGTDLSLEITKRYAEPPILVSLEGIPELKQFDFNSSQVRIGAAVDLSTLEFASKSVPMLERMLRYFGARQVKNRATVGGNLCNASPIGDLPPVFLSLDATFVLLSRAGERRVKASDFFLAYRKTALAPKEILGRVEFAPLGKDVRATSYKVSKRRELDISCVSAAFAVELDGENVKSARLAYGGMAATPLRAKQVEAALVGKPWTQANVDAAAKLLDGDFKPLSDHRGSAPYRMLVAKNLLRGFFEETRTSSQPRLPHPHTATVQAGAPTRTP